MSFEYKNKCEWIPDIQGFVSYILMLENGKRYKGYTSHFKQRMLSHFNVLGGQGYMSSNTPIYILHHEIFSTKKEALDREKFFKSSEGYNWLKNNTHLFQSIKP